MERSLGDGDLWVMEISEIANPTTGKVDVGELEGCSPESCQGVVGRGGACSGTSQVITRARHSILNVGSGFRSLEVGCGSCLS